MKNQKLSKKKSNMNEQKIINNDKIDKKKQLNKPFKNTLNF